MHHRQAYRAALIPANKLHEHGFNGVAKAPRLIQGLIHAIGVDVDHRLDLQNGANHALHQANASTLAQIFQGADHKAAQLRLPLFLQGGNHFLHGMARLQHLRRGEHQ